MMKHLPTRNFGLGGLLAFFIQLLCLPVFACDCPDNPPPLEELKAAKFVFTGRVVERSLANPYWLTDKFPYVHRTSKHGSLKFNVQEVWKGDLEEALVTSDLTIGCMDNFKVGEDYLVYAYDDSKGDRGLITTCTRTELLKHCSEDLAALGKGYLPKNTSKGSNLPAIFVFLLTLTLPILLLWLLHQRKHQSL